MATGITGRLIRRTTKEPLQGVTIEAINASTGVSASTTTTTDTKGFFELSGLTSAVYFAKPLVSGDDWDLLPNIAKVYTDTIVAAGGGVGISKTLTGSGTVAGALIIDTSADSGASVSSNIEQIREVSVPAATTLTAINHVVLNAGSTGSGAINTVKGVVIDTMNGATSNVGLQISGTFGGSASNYGIQILTPTSGANNYAIYSSAGAKSYFAGAVDVVGALTHNGTAVSDSGHGAADHANRTRYLHLVPIGWDVTIGTSPRYMTFADGATTNILFGAVLPEDYVGSSCTLKFLYGSSVTSNNLRIATNVYQDQDGQAESNIDSNTRTVAVSGSANVMTLFSEAIGSNPTADSYIKVVISRIGADAADTNTGTARITTPWIEYTADS